MSDEISKLPPNVQERLLRLQQLQQTLQSILAQKQQVEMEKTEVDQTIAELQKTADDAVIYKAIGSLLVKAEKAKSKRGTSRTQVAFGHKKHSYGKTRRTHTQPS